MQMDYYCILVNFIFVSSYFYKCIPIYYYTLTLSYILIIEIFFLAYAYVYVFIEQ